jgi:hypothetical protein
MLIWRILAWKGPIACILVDNYIFYLFKALYVRVDVSQKIVIQFQILPFACFQRRIFSVTGDLIDHDFVGDQKLDISLVPATMIQ